MKFELAFFDDDDQAAIRLAGNTNTVYAVVSYNAAGSKSHYYSTLVAFFKHKSHAMEWGSTNGFYVVNANALAGNGAALSGGSCEVPMDDQPTPPPRYA